jgi:hypothetical protein
MKTTILICFVVLFFSIPTNAQLRIDPLGNVGLGINSPDPDYKLSVKGSVLLTTFPVIPFNCNLSHRNFTWS